MDSESVAYSSGKGGRDFGRVPYRCLETGIL